MTSNVTYVRWKACEPRRARVFSPLGPNHPAVSTRCVLCSQFIGIALPVQLFVIGPEPHDVEGRERHAAGRWYAALALIVHAGCLDAEADEQLDTFARQLDRFLWSARRPPEVAVNEAGTECPHGPHRPPEGPNEDASVCVACRSATWELRPEGETYGDHLPDCSLPRRHEGQCAPGGSGHPRAAIIRGHWPEASGG